MAAMRCTVPTISQNAWFAVAVVALAVTATLALTVSQWLALAACLPAHVAAFCLWTGWRVRSPDPRFADMQQLGDYLRRHYGPTKVCDPPWYSG